MADCEQNTNLLHLSARPDASLPMRISYLDRLNTEQRQAVERGVGKANGQGRRPLLVIAGAGSGKTSTLAHRVAHLIISGADPRRILLMTFSRRAAAQMTRRAERILDSATGQGGPAANTQVARTAREVLGFAWPSMLAIEPLSR